MPAESSSRSPNVWAMKYLDGIPLMTGMYSKSSTCAGLMPCRGYIIDIKLIDSALQMMRDAAALYSLAYAVKASLAGFDLNTLSGRYRHADICHIH